MDWLTFFSNAIDSLSWPVAVLILVYVSISNGSQISRVIKSLKYKDFELTFREDFTKAKEISDGLKVSNKNISQNKLSKYDIEDIMNLAELDCSMAVFKIWQELEAKMIQLIQHNGLIRFTNPVKFIGKLLELGKITDADAELFNRLRKIRNDVVHLSPYGNNVNLTMAEVLEYKEFVDTFLGRLESIRKEDGYINI